MRCKVPVHFTFGHPPLGDVWQLPTPLVQTPLPPPHSPTPWCNRVTDCQLHCSKLFTLLRCRPRSSGQSQTSHVMSHYLLRWIWTAGAPCSQEQIVHIERLTRLVNDKLRRTLSRKSTKIVVLNWWQQPARTSSDQIKGFCAAIEMSWQFPVHKFTQWTFVCWKLFNLHFYNMSGSKLFSHLEFEEEKYKIICFRHLVSPIDCIVHKCHWWKWTFHFILVASLQWETNQSKSPQWETLQMKSNPKIAAPPISWQGPDCFPLWFRPELAFPSYIYPHIIGRGWMDISTAALNTPLY